MVGEGKSQMIGPETIRPKNTIFSLEEIWKRKFSSEQILMRDRCQFSQLQGKVSRKKSRTESLDRSQQKGTDSANSGNVTCP